MINENLVGEINTPSFDIEVNFGGGPVSWDNIENKPSTFPPSSHTHAIADVTNLQSTLTSQSEAMTTLNAKLKSGSEQDAEYHLGFYLDENGDLCQVETEG